MHLESVADVAPAPLPAADQSVGPRIWGVIDVLRVDRVAGWAIDRSDSGAALDVDILRDGRVVRTVRADRRRPDLEKGGIGTGAYGFRAEIEPPLEPGFEFTLAAIARAPDGAQSDLKRVGAAIQAHDATTLLLQRIYACVAGPASAAATPEPRPVAAEPDRLTQIVERIEMAQARIEAALAGIEPQAPTGGERGLRGLVFAALGVAILSLAAGFYSLWAT